MSPEQLKLWPDEWRLFATEDLELMATGCDVPDYVLISDLEVGHTDAYPLFQITFEHLDVEGTWTWKYGIGPSGYGIKWREGELTNAMCKCALVPVEEGS